MLSLRVADGARTIGPVWLEYGFVQITALAGWPIIVLLTVALSGLFLIRKQFKYLGVILAVIIGESVLVSMLKSFFDRERPDFIYHLVEVGTKSFPSGHSASAAAFYLTVGLMAANMSSVPVVRRYIMTISIVVIMLIGASRIFLGVHYPTDVIAGFAIGAAWASAIWLISWKLLP